MIIKGKLQSKWHVMTKKIMIELVPRRMTRSGKDDINVVKKVFCMGWKSYIIVELVE